MVSAFKLHTGSVRERSRFPVPTCQCPAKGHPESLCTAIVCDPPLPLVLSQHVRVGTCLQHWTCTVHTGPSHNIGGAAAATADGGGGNATAHASAATNHTTCTAAADGRGATADATAATNHITGTATADGGGKGRGGTAHASDATSHATAAAADGG